VRLLLGLARPSAGEALLLGRDPTSIAARERVGVMLQVSKVPETLRVAEHIRLFSSYYPMPLPLAEIIDLAGLTGLEDRAFGKLSGGQQQRLLFALAICGDPEFLVLDEPTVGLDVEARRAFWSEMRRLVARGRSLLLTTHYLEEADALADRIVILQAGRIIADGLRHRPGCGRAHGVARRARLAAGQARQRHLRDGSRTVRSRAAGAGSRALGPGDHERQSRNGVRRTDGIDDGGRRRGGSPVMDASIQRRFRIYARESGYECLKQLRLPVALVFGLGFPLMFYTVFGLLFGRGSGYGASFGLYYIATYGAFGIMNSALYGFGVDVATERGQGWMLLKRASPMPFEAYFIAKLAKSLLFSFVSVILLTIAGAVLLGVRVSPLAWLEMALVLVVGVAPFCALGLAIGYWVGPNSAIAVVNVISMPMAIVSGLWIPLNVLPSFVHRIAIFMPAYHYGQLALGIIGQGQPESTTGHVLVLVGFMVLCLVLAHAGYRRDEDKTYG
jgi:ABC-type multidrug transport system ATPase subunit/ABC-type multidrug transport system permease subunit